MAIRIPAAAKEFGVSAQTIVSHLQDNGYDVSVRSKLDDEMYSVLLKEFHKDKELKQAADKIELGGVTKEKVVLDKDTGIGDQKAGSDNDEVLVKRSGANVIETKEDVVEVVKEEPEEKLKAPEKEEKAPVAKEEAKEESTKEEPKEEVKEEKVPEDENKGHKLAGPKVLGKIDVDAVGKKGKKKKEPEKEVEAIEEVAEEPVSEEVVEEKKAVEEVPEKAKPEEETVEHIETKKTKLSGPKVLGKIDLPVERPKKSKESDDSKSKRKRKRVQKPVRVADVKGKNKEGRRTKKGKDEVKEISGKEIEEKIKSTMSKLSGSGASQRSKRKRAKRKEHEATTAAEEEASALSRDLEVTEFITVSELASLMDISPTEIIRKCFEIGMVVSINQRLDAEIIELIAEEFEFNVNFIDISDQELDIDEEDDDPEDLKERAPIVTIMGHVDHGKTSLLDYIRKESVVAGEVGGITQHIGAYEVTTSSGKEITFLDTPGHEAFTAMRARGAKVTDVAVIVIAADDSVMPQTKEAISHAQAAGVPMIFALNKIDKDTANPDVIKKQLADMDILVEDWGGKYQCQDISAKTGLNVDDLLEKILLEAEMLELKANPEKRARGSVIEASLDKGRGYVATILVQSGTMVVGDPVVAGQYSGKIKAMFNERGQEVKKAGPSTPVLVLGLNGAPQAGEIIASLDTEQKARELANKRQQLVREQGIRTRKHITLDEIGRRLALGSFKELNVIIKADFDGSVEAMSDSLLKLNTEEVQVNIIHRGVGQITESDVLLASASDAIIIGFQVRPSSQARNLAEKESIEIRLYSIIYNAIEEIKSALEGMLEPKVEEKINSNIEVREVFKIGKLGTIAGCFMTEGKIQQNAKVRLIRDGIVVHSGRIDSLRRFKDDVKEVVAGQDCGIHIKDYNDIKVGDVIESYEEIEVKRKL